jgi:hypothetical protein
MERFMRKHLVAATITVATLTGLGAGFAFGSPALVGAQTDPSTTIAKPADPAAPATPKPARVDYVSDALKKLVAAGTITQTQADAVAAAIKDARPAGGPGGAGGPGMGRGGHDGGMKGGMMAGGAGIIDAAAKALGITADELITQVKAGTTVAKIAESKNVPLNTVVSAVVTELSTKLDDAVKAGKLTQADADAKKAALTKTVTDFANGTMPMPGAGRGQGGPGGPGMGGPGMGGRGARGPKPAAAPTTPTSVA